MTDRAALAALENGHPHRFADWPNPAVPKASAGVYTIWDGRQFIYVGMAGRGMNAIPDEAPDDPRKAKGLWTRLNSHASGRRSGDQFCVYICDRFVVPALTPGELSRLAEGQLRLDESTREYIRGRLQYRFVQLPDAASAFGLELEIQAGALGIGKPYLNPR